MTIPSSYTRNQFSRCILLALLLFSLQAAQAGVVNFNDNFNNSPITWTNIDLVGTSTTSIVANNGNPGGYQQTSAPSATATVHLMDSANYDPSSQGAILNISMGLDYITANAPGTSASSSQFFPLILQNNQYYRTSFPLVAGTSWQAYSTGALTILGIFCLNSGCTTQPNLTDAMQFGYISVQQSGSALLGADNFRVQITNATPEPSTWALLAGALVLVGLRRFRLVLAGRRGDLELSEIGYGATRAHRRGV